MASSTDPYLQAYREAQTKYGNQFGVTLWASEESQATRFRVITEMLYLAGKRILDAGCSRGDFAAYLLDRDIGYSSYVGIDAIESVVDFAKARGLAGARFVHGDLVREPELLAASQPQIVVLSGTLNTMDDQIIMSLLESAWSAAGEALIFNFLSDMAGEGAQNQSYPARRLSTITLLGWALTRTWSVQFRHDYFQCGHDATILMRKF